MLGSLHFILPSIIFVVMHLYCQIDELLLPHRGRLDWGSHVYNRNPSEFAACPARAVVFDMPIRSGKASHRNSRETPTDCDARL